MAVCGLLVVTAGNDFLWAASEGLGFELLDFELFAGVVMGRGGPGRYSSFGLGLFAAVNEL